MLNMEKMKVKQKIIPANYFSEKKTALGSP